VAGKEVELWGNKEKGRRESKSPLITIHMKMNKDFIKKRI